MSPSTLLLASLLAYFDSTDTPLALLCAAPKIFSLCESRSTQIGPWSLSRTSDGLRHIQWQPNYTTCHASVSDRMRLLLWWCNRPSASVSPSMTSVDLRLASRLLCGPDDLTSVTRLCALVALDLRNAPMKDVNALGQLPLLRRLDLTMSGVVDSGILGLGESPSLTEVNLWGCRAITCVNALGRISTLRRLVLAETSVWDGGMIGLSSCLNLVELDLDACACVTNVGFLGRLPHLRLVKLVTTGTSSDGIVGLSHSKSLEEIDLWGCLAVEDVRPLATIPTLRRLDLSHTLVTNESIEALSRSRSLECIDLTECIHVSDVSPLGRIPTLYLVELSLTPVAALEMENIFGAHVTVIV